MTGLHHEPEDPLSAIAFTLSARVKSAEASNASWEGRLIYIQAVFCLWHDYLVLKSRMPDNRKDEKLQKPTNVFLAVVGIQL